MSKNVDMSVADRVGVLAELTQLFAKNNISLRTVRQAEHGETARLLMVTHTAKEADLAATVTALKGLDAVHTVNSVIRLAGE